MCMTGWMARELCLSLTECGKKYFTALTSFKQKKINELTAGCPSICAVESIISKYERRRHAPNSNILW